MCAGPAGRVGAQAVQTEQDRDRYTRTLPQWFALAREQSLRAIVSAFGPWQAFNYARLVRYDASGIPCCSIRQFVVFLRSYTRSISSREIGCSRTSSTSLQDFWRRWHVTLSFWLRDYLYVPLGGSRRGTVRTHANLLLTMALGGLWHGASWNFVIIFTDKLHRTRCYRRSFQPVIVVALDKNRRM